MKETNIKVSPYDEDIEVINVFSDYLIDWKQVGNRVVVIEDIPELIKAHTNNDNSNNDARHE